MRTGAPDWADARARVLLNPDVTYLNVGAAGPLPRVVHQRVSALRDRLAAEPLGFLQRQAPPLLGSARAQLAKFIGGDARRLVLTANVTAAVNLLAHGLDVRGPGEVLLTDHEYAPMRWAWERAARRRALSMRFLTLPRMPAGPGEIISAAAAAMGPRTKVFFFSHVLSSTGTVLPAAELCELAHAHHAWSIVDGAHGPAFTDLDVSALGCDFYIGSGHKWLLAPTGTGFLHFAPSAADRLEPLQVSWGYRSPGNGNPESCGYAGLAEAGEHGESLADAFGRTALVRHLEIEGTRDICSWLALPDAIGFQAALGHEAVRARMRALATLARERLSGWRGLTPVTPDHPRLHGGMTAFALPREADPEKLRRLLWERHRIEVAIIEQPNRSLLRVSTHFFTTESDIERLRAALGELMRSK